MKNLDTGAEMDLQTAEEQLPQSINPLSLQIMRLTGEYTGTGSRLAGRGNFVISLSIAPIIFHIIGTGLTLVEQTVTMTAWLPALSLS